MSFRFSVVVGLIAGVMANNADASPIMSAASGLSSPAVQIDFGVSGTSDTPVVSQYAAQGVTFASGAPDGGLYWFPYAGTAPQVGGNVGNFTSIDWIGYSPFSINFTVDQTAAAFLLWGLDLNWTFEALLNGVLVESFTSSVSSTVSAYFGFTNILFDEIRLTGPLSGNDEYNIVLLDDLQLSVAPLPPSQEQSNSNTSGVPAPGSLALVGLGLIGLVRTRRRV